MLGPKAGGRCFPALLAYVALCSACAETGSYVWVHKYTPAGDQAGEYLLASGDLIQVRVFNQEAMSTRTRIRADGKVSLPFLNDVAAAGQSPSHFAKTLDKLLLDFIRQPVVTVSVEEMHPSQVSLVGEVVRPGVYPIEPGQGVLRALAAGGGLTEFAHKDRIYVLRQSLPQRIRFSMQELTTPGTAATRFRLLGDDAIVVE